MAAMAAPVIANASHWVRGYTRSNGTYVQGHMSMDPGESRATGMSYHNNQLVPRGQYRDSSNSYSAGTNSYAGSGYQSSSYSSNRSSGYGSY